jgi:carboxypeptidase Taq
VAELFARLRDQLVPLVRELGSAPRQPDVSICQRRFPRAAQEQFARQVAAAFGYDFEAGRLDVSTHPFCMSMSSRDVRITTRYDENHPASSIFSVMHEVGHALYEQGLLFDHAFTPAGMACSLGIHESQSRLWENMIGRSRPFWEGRYKLAQELFADALGGVSVGDFYAAINAVRPSLIRVEADEVTYNLHIILRFEIERELIAGRLSVGEIPGVWNEKMQRIVGITPPDDARGCLQDIHWSIGAIGYVPTYALGNLYAGQFFATIREALPNLDESIRAGDFTPVLDWLRENIHRHGMCYRAGELCERVTGRSLSTEPLIAYLKEKYRPIYGIDGR